MADIPGSNTSSVPAPDRGSKIKKKMRKYLFIGLTTCIVVVKIWIYRSCFLLTAMATV